MDPNTGEREMIEIIRQLAPSWKKVAMFIGLNRGIIMDFERDGIANEGRCLMNVIEMWKYNLSNHRARYPVTWKGMYDLLEDSQHRRLARNLENAIDADISTLRQNYKGRSLAISDQTWQKEILSYQH